jgi:hypothetical protein
VEHPDFSPDIVSCDFFLFPCMKNHLKGTQLETHGDRSKYLARELLLEVLRRLETTLEIMYSYRRT